MSAARVLIVAPDNDLRRSLSFALAAYGYAVTVAQAWTGDEQAGPFDCILLDEHALPKNSAGSFSVGPGPCPVLLLAYSEGAIANQTVSQVIAMPLTGEAVMLAVGAAVSAGRAATT